MKKIGLILMMAVMAVGLIGCSNNAEVGNNNSVNNSTNIQENNNGNNNSNNSNLNNVENNVNENNNEAVNNNNAGNNKETEEEEINEIVMKLYFSDEQAMYLEAEERVVADITIEGVISGLLDGPSNAELLPTLSGLNSSHFENVYTEGSRAYIDFTGEVDTILSQSGSAGATMIIESIVASLCLNDDLGVSEVQFMLEGEIVEAMGQMAMSNPMKPNMDMIK